MGSSAGNIGQSATRSAELWGSRASAAHVESREGEQEMATIRCDPPCLDDSLANLCKYRSLGPNTPVYLSRYGMLCCSTDK